MDIVYFLLAIVAATPFLVYYGICNALPENLQTTPMGDHDIPAALRDRIAEFLSFGFERDGPALTVQLQGEPLIVPLVNRERGLMATVFEFSKPKVRRGYDVVSLLEPGSMALTTGMDIGAGALPQPSNNFVQILPDAPVRELLGRHEQALQFLDQESGGTQRMLPARVEDAIRESFRRNRRHFDRNKVRSTLSALYRVIAKSNPHIGPLVTQAHARDQVRKLRETFPAPRQQRVRQRV